MLDLTALERDVLMRLSMARVTRSVVILAADMWGESVQDADPVGLITIVLESLNFRGLVVYELADHHGAEHAWNGLPQQIRLTQKGWAACGYTDIKVEVGLRSARLRLS